MFESVNTHRTACTGWLRVLSALCGLKCFSGSRTTDLFCSGSVDQWLKVFDWPRRNSITLI